MISSVGRDLGIISGSKSEDSRYSRYLRPSKAILIIKIDKNNRF